MTQPEVFKLAPDQTGRMKAANALLQGTPYKPRLYPTTHGLRIFVDRMASNWYPNIDKLAIVNPATGFFQKSARNTNNAGFPWGSTQESVIAELVTWVLGGGVWRAAHWERVVAQRVVDAQTVAAFLRNPCVKVTHD